MLRRPKSIFCVTVFHGKSANCWNTTERSGPGPVTALPPTLTTPVPGNSRPAAIRRQVVLPQPDGPTIVTNSLSRTSKLTSSSVGKSRPSRLNTRLTRSNTMLLNGGPSRPQQDLGGGGSAAIEIGERRRAVGERPLLHPREIAERSRVECGNRRVEIGGRVRVSADQRDLGERELAHVDLAGPVH